MVCVREFKNSKVAGFHINIYFHKFIQKVDTKHNPVPSIEGTFSLAMCFMYHIHSCTFLTHISSSKQTILSQQKYLEVYNQAILVINTESLTFNRSWVMINLNVQTMP